MAHELLVKGGRVVDPAQGMNAECDIGIDQGRIAALAPNIPASEAEMVIEAQGLLVTPGLIDIHTHVAEGIVSLAAAPDQAGVHAGVTTVCDAGSTGYANFDGFGRYVMPRAQTDVFAFLHLAPVGEAVLPEIGWQHVSAEKMLETVQANPGIIKGVKVRATMSMVAALGPNALQKAKQVASDAELPLVVHLGIDAGESVSDPEWKAQTEGMLSNLEPGDVLTHVYTKKQGGLFEPDGGPVSGLREAMERGVVLDIASAIGHLDFQVARKAIDRGILPDTLSTDLTRGLLTAPVPFGLPVLMSEFLALGLDLDRVVGMATANPARVLGEESTRGSLRVGLPADISIFELLAGDYVFIDSRDGNVLRGEALLVPKATLKRGVRFKPLPRFTSYAQWSQEVSPMLAARQGT
jgi:dihydroorotase